MYDAKKFFCPNCGKQISEQKNFQDHLDQHFRAKNEKTQASFLKSAGFLDRTKWKNVSYNFAREERELSSAQHRGGRRGPGVPDPLHRQVPARVAAERPL